MQTFWKKWRAELVRGSAIFIVVVASGLLLVSAFAKAKAKAASAGGNALGQVMTAISASLGGNFDDPGRHHGDTWSWHAKVTPGQTLSLRNLNGPVEVSAATGTETVVTAEKSWLNSDPASVTIEAVPTSSGTMVCAVFPGSNGGECAPGHDVNVHLNGRQHNDVVVKFVVQVAPGVKVDVGSVSGDVKVAGATSAVGVNTVSGDISVETSSWPVTLSTVSGDITASTGAAAAGSSEVKSVSGDVTLQVPSKTDLFVSAHSISGDISDDFDLPVQEAKFGSSQSLSGTIGKGGGTLNINTVSGDISLNKATVSTVQVLTAKKHGVTAVRVTATPPAAPAAPAAPAHP